mgnify:CR=1 FL=1
MTPRPHVTRPAPDPLVVPLWIIAACAVLWTLGAALWFYRAERAIANVEERAKR